MEKDKNKIIENNTFINNDLTVDNQQETMYTTAAAFVAQMTSQSSSFSFQQKKQEQKFLFSSPFFQNTFSVSNNLMPINNSKQSNSLYNFLHANMIQNHDIILPSTSVTTNNKKNTISLNHQLPVNLQAQAQQWSNQIALNGKTKISEIIPFNFNSNTTQCENINNQLQSMHMSSSILPFPILREDDGIIDHPQVDLEDKNLWNTFSSCINEMIITKSGRQFFIKN